MCDILNQSKYSRCVYFVRSFVCRSFERSLNKRNMPYKITLESQNIEIISVLVVLLFFVHEILLTRQSIFCVVLRKKLKVEPERAAAAAQKMQTKPEMLND